MHQGPQLNSYSWHPLGIKTNFRGSIAVTSPGLSCAFLIYTRSFDKVKVMLYMNNYNEYHLLTISQMWGGICGWYFILDNYRENIVAWRSPFCHTLLLGKLDV